MHPKDTDLDLQPAAAWPCLEHVWVPLESGDGRACLVCDEHQFRYFGAFIRRLATVLLCMLVLLIGFSILGTVLP